MDIRSTSLPEVKIIEPKVFGDQRGWFMETYNYQNYHQHGVTEEFIQDNHSFSRDKGVLRGLHYQLIPKAQTKLIRCTRGAIFDVAVDIRKGSPTYGQWVGVELTAENRKQLLVPKGFAHGFLTLEENTEVQYKVDEYYSPDQDRSIKWDDGDIDIDWPVKNNLQLSDKDKNAPGFKEADNNFDY